MIEVAAGGQRYDEMHVDGGVCAQVFMYPAALDMRKLSTELNAERRRSIYVIRNGKTTPEKSPVERSLFSIAARSMSCLILNQGVGDLRCGLPDGGAGGLLEAPPGFDAPGYGIEGSAAVPASSTP